MLLTIAFSFTSVQTWVGKKAVSVVNNTYDTDFQLQYLQYKFPNIIHLEEVFLPDDIYGDTLLYAKNIDFTFTAFANRTLYSSHIEVDKLHFVWLTHQEDSLAGFQRFIAKFKKDEPSNKKPFGMEVGNVSLHESRFRFENKNCSNCVRYWLHNLNIEAEDFDLDGAFFELDVEQLSAADYYGFDVAYLQTHFAFLEGEMRLDNFQLQTEKSKAKGQIAMYYTAMPDFKDFVNKVNLIGNLEEGTEVASSEIMQYSSQFPNFGVIDISGDVSGTVNDMQLKKLQIKAAQHTYFSGDISLKNTTDVNELYINSDALKLLSSAEDAIFFNNLFSDTTLPEIVNRFEEVQFEGAFKGALRDFETKGILQTNLGSIKADLQLKNPEDKPQFISYEGKVQVDSLDLGILLNDSLLGKLSTNLTLKGRGVDPVQMETYLLGNISQFGFKGYRYSGMKVNGLIANGRFKGNFNVDDPNLQFNFDGHASFSADTSEYQFVAKLNKANLPALHLVKDSMMTISSEMDIDFRALNYNQWEGDIRVTNTTLSNKDNFYFFEDILLSAVGLDSSRSMSLKSNIIDANLSGNYTISGLIEAFGYHITKYLKSSKDKYLPPKEDFNFDIAVKNTQVITEIFLPKLFIEPNSTIKGSYTKELKGLVVEVNSPGLAFNNNQIRDIDLSYKGSDVKSLLDFDIKQAQLSSGIEFENLSLSNFYYRDTVLYNLKWILKDSIDSKANITGYALQLDSLSFQFGIDSSGFNIGNQNFAFNPSNTIVLDTGGIHIQNLIITNQDKRIVINGNVSENEYEILRVDLEGFGMEILNYFIGSEKARFKGNLNGGLIASQLLSSPRFAANLSVDSLEMNSTLLGNLNILSDWTPKNDTISLAADLQLGTLKAFDVKGYYQPDSLGSIDFDVKFDQFKLAALNPLLTGLVENLRGYADGNIKVKGNTGKPEVTGDLYLPKAAMTVSFLQTDYSLSGNPHVKILENEISFPDIVLKDTQHQTEGKLSGTVKHTGFRDFDLDLSIKTEKLLALNTKPSLEDYYYGKAFVSGEVKMIGPLDALVISADIVTQKGTKFFIPLDASSNVSKSEFVDFINKNEEDSTTENQSNRLNLDKGVSLDFNIGVTKDAVVQIIVDQQDGTQLTSTGDADLRLRIAPYGDIELYGTYTTYEGEFIFSLQGALRKQFAVQQGGVITWNGDMMDALMDITARYSTRADPSVLYEAGTPGRTLVNIDLNLSGELMNPNIGFDISLPRKNSTDQTIIASRLSDENKMNQQVFSLLAFNSFAPDQGIGNNTGGNGNLTADLLTSQLTNYINKVTGDYEVSLNYQASNKEQLAQDPDAFIQQEEVEVGVSKRFFDDRVTVNGALGVAVGELQRQNQFAGDIELEYSITKDGRLQAKAFNRAIQYPTVNLSGQQQGYQRGLGISYRFNYNAWNEFFKQMFNPLGKSKQEAENNKEEQPKAAIKEEEAEG